MCREYRANAAFQLLSEFATTLAADKGRATMGVFTQAS